jgi:hypothetical protein
MKRLALPAIIVALAAACSFEQPQPQTVALPPPPPPQTDARLAAAPQDWPGAVREPGVVQRYGQYRGPFDLSPAAAVDQVRRHGPYIQPGLAPYTPPRPPEPPPAKPPENLQVGPEK